MHNDARLTIRLPEDVKKSYDAYAGDAGLSVSAWLRALADVEIARRNEELDAAHAERMAGQTSIDEALAATNGHELVESDELVFDPSLGLG